ncbi:GNAT family N-acetyltransferase [Tannockella kyphosi]|uniref:GNAT family N-acetyltransferase n=1 Tax=Tannockella kyphosi TaxID=2899121 RepID=UPI002012B001|nr:GNAT family N-acetyltransferase [Tannockella kyphosi]
MIKTERLIINQLHQNDAKAFSSYRNKPEVYQYQTWSNYSIFRAKIRINQCNNQVFHKDIFNYQLAIRLLDNTLIGDFYLEPIDEKSIVLGYTLDNVYWNQGYASEALQAMLHWLKEVHHYFRIECHVYMDNVRSIGLLKKNGFHLYKECNRENIESYEYLLEG